jgi:hypothetical protein
VTAIGPFVLRDGNRDIPAGDLQNVLPLEMAKAPRSCPRPRSRERISPRPRPRVGITSPMGTPAPTNPQELQNKNSMIAD